MTNFEDHLWTELVREHGDVLVAPQRTSMPHDRRRPRLLAGAGLGLAGTGTALALILGAGTAAPAFAVTRNHDGTVTISIRRSNAIAGANARLAQLGIPVTVAVHAPAGCGQTISLKGAPRPGRGQPRPAVRTSWTIDPRHVPAGRTMVLSPAPRYPTPGNPPPGPRRPRNYARRTASPPGGFCVCPISIHGKPGPRGSGKNTAVHLVQPHRSGAGRGNRVCRLNTIGGAPLTSGSGHTVTRRAGVRG